MRSSRSSFYIGTRKRRALYLVSPLCPPSCCLQPSQKLTVDEDSSDSSSSSSSSSSRLPFFHEQIDGRFAPLCGTRTRQLWTTLIAAYLLCIVIVIGAAGFGVLIALFLLTPIFVSYPSVRVVPVFFTKRTSDRTKCVQCFGSGWLRSPRSSCLSLCCQDTK